eukprot:669983-Alexandrium_andersonii.AAC.1
MASRPSTVIPGWPSRVRSPRMAGDHLDRSRSIFLGPRDLREGAVGPQRCASQSVGGFRGSQGRGPRQDPRKNRLPGGAGQVFWRAAGDLSAPARVG